MRKSARTKRLESVNLLDLRPVRTESWEEQDGRIVIVRTSPTGQRRRRPREWFRFWLSSRRIRLDEPGSRVWRLLDGNRTVAEVAQELRSEFGQEVEPAEERIGQMVRRLHDEELVGYPGWEEVEARGEKLS